MPLLGLLFDSLMQKFIPQKNSLQVDNLPGVLLCWWGMTDFVLQETPKDQSSAVPPSSSTLSSHCGEHHHKPDNLNKLPRWPLMQDVGEIVRQSGR